MRGRPGQVIAGCFALTAFIVAVVAGLSNDNPSSTILFRSLVALMLCYPVGFVIGILCERVVNEHLRASGDSSEAAPGSAATGPGAASAAPKAEEDALVV